ncbi:MAG: hypothetical protein H7X95_07670 [Deltaproteobacteria bacterium]|nr:hypothetical protein [Deltaproteobacteria bacterium]
MMSFSVVGPDGSMVETETDAGASIPVPPLSHFVAIFDRLLDPTTLLDVDEDAGTIEPKPPTTRVAIITWLGGGSAESKTAYVSSNHHKFALFFPPGPSLTTTPLTGLPSGTGGITVTFDPDKVRSRDQSTPFAAAQGVKSSLVLVTEPLMVSFDVPVPDPADGGASDDDAGDGGSGPGMALPVPADFVAHVLFNNYTSADTAAAIEVTGTLAGVPIAALGAAVAADAENPASWTVSPPTTGWPSGAVITISVGAAAADRFGVALGAPASASFTVAP